MYLTEYEVDPPPTDICFYHQEENLEILGKIYITWMPNVFLQWNDWCRWN